MKPFFLANELKDISKMIREEKNEQDKKYSRLVQVLSEIFPYDEYLKARRDVYQAHGNNKEKIINHFLNHAINAPEINLKELVIKTNNTGMDNIYRYARDVANIKTSNDTEDLSKRRLCLSKTSGNPCPISENKMHESARLNTIVHLKSNSICTWIPKNACTTLRYSIAVDNGVISGINEIEWIHQNNKSFSATNNELLKTSYAFTILRNPFKRLLSFYLDKICSDNTSTLDKSYINAKNMFKASADTTFEDFVEAIYTDQTLISKDIHTRRQCDFLVYRNYDDYYAFEDFENTRLKIKEKIGLNLLEIRKNMSITTTYKKEESPDFTHSLTASEANKLLKKNKKPIAENMYTRQMIGKVGAIYFSDVILYAQVISNGEKELENWLREITYLA